MAKKTIPPSPGEVGRTEGFSPAFWMWTAALSALAFVPDEKLLRHKLLALETLTGALVLWTGFTAATGRAAARVRTALDGPVLALAASGLVFYALSPERSVSLSELTRLGFSAAVFFAATQTALELELRPLARAWAWPAGLMGLYALLQTRGGLGPIAVPYDARPFATFGNPIFLGAYLSASACVAVGLAASEGGAARAAAWLAAAACLAGLWTTQSRAAMGGLAAAACAWASLAGPRRARPLAALAALGLLGLGWLRFHGREWTHALIWRDSLRLWLAHPWLGCGLGRYHVEFPAFASPELRALWPQERVIVNFAHDEYLQVLAETGILGLGVAAWVFAAFAAWALRDWPSAQDSGPARLIAGFAAAATALWVQALASPDLRFGVSSFLLYFAMGCAAARCGARVEPLSPKARGAMAAAAAAFLLAWGPAAASPFLAERKLEREPGFHVAATPEVQAAIDALERRLKAEPDSVEAAENLAYLYAREKAWQPAIERYALVTRLAPSRPGPFNNIGNIYYSIGDLPHAIEYWRRSVGLQPDQVDAHVNLGKALYETGKLKESAAELEAALKLDPNNEKARILLRKMVE